MHGKTIRVRVMGLAQASSAPSRQSRRPDFPDRRPPNPRVTVSLICCATVMLLVSRGLFLQLGQACELPQPDSHPNRPRRLPAGRFANRARDTRLGL